MIPSSLYIHPRPRTVYEPPMAKQPRQPVARPSAEARLRAIRQAKLVEQQVVRDWWPYLNADDQNSFIVRSSEAGRTVGEVSMHNHRTQTHETWKTFNVACKPGRTRNSPSKLPPESSMSTLSLPPVAPTCLPQPTNSSVDIVHRDTPKLSRSPRPPRGHTTAVDPVPRPTIRLLEVSENAHRPSSPAPKLPIGHRPSRSHSSSLRQSLSRSPSQQSLVADTTANTMPRKRTLSANRLLSFVKRLAPLPRFNPYKRSRAESTSAIVDNESREKGKMLGSQACRRRCKSDSTVPS